MLLPADADRWLDVWEHITENVSRWAIGALTIAAIAGTTQGLTAFLLGSSYAVALGLIAGFLDLIPNIGATIAGVHPRAGPLGRGGRHGRGDHARGRPRLPAGREQPARPTIYGKAVNISPFFVILGVTLFGRAARRARRARRRARHGIAAAHPAGGHEGAARADRGDAARPSARRRRGASTRRGVP